MTKINNKDIRIGIIGFGKVGYTFTKGLKDNGVNNINVYDIALEYNDNQFMKEKIKQTNAQYSLKLKTLIDKSNIIFSTVTADVAVTVAENFAKQYKKDKNIMYIDFNSSSPQTQEKIKNIIEDINGDFIDCAIMGSISLHGYDVPIVASGKKRSEFQEIFNDLGMDINIELTKNAGEASAFKMFRSSFTKGIECLLIESLIGAYKYGIGDQVYDSISSFINNKEFKILAENLITTHALHSKRRASEMNEVCKTFNDTEIEPLLSKASEETLRKTTRTNAKDYFNNEKPENYKEVLDYLIKNYKGGK